MSYCPLTALPILFEGSRFLIKVLCGGLFFFFCKVEQMKCIWKRCRGELLLFVMCSGKHRGFLCAVKTVLCFWPQVSSFSESGWTSASQTAALSSTAAFWPVSPSVHLHPYLFSFCCFDTILCGEQLGWSSSAAPECRSWCRCLCIFPGVVFLCQTLGSCCVCRQRDISCSCLCSACSVS